MQITKARFRYTIWFIISEKVSRDTRFFNVVVWGWTHAPKFSTNQAYKKHVYQNFEFFQTLKITFKTFLKENYAVALDSYYLFTIKMLKIKLNVILIVLMEFAYIRNSWTLLQSWCITCNLSRWWIWESVSL